MKIAVIAPPWEVLPSNDNAGIETTVSDLCSKLGELGNKVILFAPAGSEAKAKIIEYPEDLEGTDWSNATSKERYYHKTLLAKYASAKAVAMGADIIHNFTLTGEFKNSIPSVYTVFGPPSDDIVDNCLKIAEYTNNHLVTVSMRQRVLFAEAAPDIKFKDTIYKSIDVDKTKYNLEKDDYLLFIGHVEQANALDLARRVANATGNRLMAIVQGADERTFNTDIKPWLENSSANVNFQFSENLSIGARFNLYRKAKATFSINQWEDPFGVDMIESLACATPVIALSKGAANEVIDDGKTGFIVFTEKEMTEAVKKISEIDPMDCRKAAEEKFSSEIMASKYLELYSKILK